MSPLDIKVTMAVSPTWLVAKYIVVCTYESTAGIQSCGDGMFGPEGGTVLGQVDAINGTYPANIYITVTVDFQPETGLNGIVKKYTLPVTNTGVNFLFETNRVIQETSLFFDLYLRPALNDYLLIRWKHKVEGSVVASGQKYLSGNDLRIESVPQYSIVFVPGPISAKNIDIQIEGRYREFVLAHFSQTFDLSDKAILLRPEWQTTPRPGFMLVSV